MKFRVLPEFIDSHVTLRPIRDEDVLPWAMLVQDPRVYEHTSWNLQTTAPLLHSVFDPASHTELSPLRFAIVAPETGRFLGTIGFHTVSPENCSAEIAYELAPDIWGKGIATRLCAYLTKWAHEEAGLNRVQATTLVTNERSVRVLERCLYQREGIMRQYRMVRGRPGDFYVYSSVFGT